jgi:hypothetical protein
VVEHRYSGGKGITRERGRGRRALTAKAKAVETMKTHRACAEILIVFLIRKSRFYKK